MKCLDCQYDLSAITSNRCPECGRAFDLNDSSTYAASSRTRAMAWFENWQARVIAICTLIPLLHVASGYVALVIGRIDIGRWPIRTGQDDPKSINGVTLCLCIGWFLTFYLLLPTFCVWLFSSISLWFQTMDAGSSHYSKRARYKALLTASVGIWFLTLLHLACDPADISPWMLD